MYEISLGLNPQEPKTLPENGQEWQDIRHGILLPMPSTAFDMQMIIREMMSPEWRSRPSAEMLLKKRQLLSDDERKILGLNMALDAQMVSRGDACALSCLFYLSYVCTILAHIICTYCLVYLYSNDSSNYHQRLGRVQSLSVVIHFAKEARWMLWI